MNWFDAPDARLQRLLGGSALADLRLRLRRFYLRHPIDQRPGHLRLGRLNPQEQACLAQLMGRPVGVAKTIRLDVAQIDAALAASGIAVSLRDALEKLDGPLVDQQALRLGQAQAWAAVLAGQTALPEGALDGRVLDWLQTAQASRLLKRLSRSDPLAAGHLLRQAHAVLQYLPAQGMTRAQLAAYALGDAHALDDGRALAQLVLRVCDPIWAARQLESPIAAAGALPVRLGRAMKNSAVAAEELPARTERQRSRWARVGILVNELARPALCLNMPTGDQTVYPAGRPGYLSLRDLLRQPPSWQVAGVTVYACENPNLLAIAADQLGARCPPLVCTDGMPAAAQRTLLDQLIAAGAQLAYHGDFDWPGLRIANYVLRRWPARPWCMACIDYLAAVRHAPARPNDLGQQIAHASWDDRLAPAMQQHGLMVAEEAVADALLADMLKDEHTNPVGAVRISPAIK